MNDNKEQFEIYEQEIKTLQKFRNRLEMINSGKEIQYWEMGSLLNNGLMLLNHKSQSGVFGNLKIDLPKLY